VAKSTYKRSNYLINKEFQLGFIFRYVAIIILTIVVVTSAIITYYWIVSSVGTFKLNESFFYNYQGQMTYGNNKLKVYNYNKENIRVYQDVNEVGEKVYKCWMTYDQSAPIYKTGDIVNNVDEKDLEPYITRLQKTMNRFQIIFIPLLLTGVALIVIISIYSLFFSHRMAGPVYRVNVSLDKLLEGEKDFKIRVRKNDFFVDIVEKLEKLRKKMGGKD
jgi:hypothetical protein